MAFADLRSLISGGRILWTPNEVFKSFHLRKSRRIMYAFGRSEILNVRYEATQVGSGLAWRLFTMVEKQSSLETAY